MGALLTGLLVRIYAVRGKMDSEYWVDLRVIESFKKMRAMNATVADMARALQVSALEVSDDGLRVRRTTPLPQRQAGGASF